MFGFDLAQTIQKIALILPGFLMAITFHELMHGYTAYRLGDPTPKLAGRLTINPLKHLDPIGTLVLVLTQMIGWAKPMPVDPRYFKNPNKGMMLVSFAGPATNFLLAVILGQFYQLGEHLLNTVPMSETMVDVMVPLTLICKFGAFINIVLGCFNLLPIPPLDGSNIVAGLLPHHLAAPYVEFGRWGMFIIIMLAVLGILWRILAPFVQFFSAILL